MGLALPHDVALTLWVPEVEGQADPDTDTLLLCDTVREAVEQMVGD